MLTRHQELALQALRWSFGYLEEIPVVWNSQANRISLNASKRIWKHWNIGNIFQLVIWVTCVYVLVSQLFIHRPNFKLLNYAMLTTGLCCLTATLLGSYGIFSLQQKMYLSAINEFIQLEINVFESKLGYQFLNIGKHAYLSTICCIVFTEYHPSLLFGNRQMTMVDFFLLSAQSANGIPFLIYFVSIIWDLDPVYWAVEDFLPDPKQRKIVTIVALVCIRSVMMLPALCELARATNFTVCGCLAIITYITELTNTLAFKVSVMTDFFKFYAQFSIIANVLGVAFERAFLLAITITYFLFVQTLWVLVCGYGHLDITIYIFFVITAVIVVVATVIFNPMVRSTGEIITFTPKLKWLEMTSKYLIRASFQNKVHLKKAMSLYPLRFSYGSFYPMGKRFCRNTVDNMVQNLLDVILLFDITGPRL